MNDWTRRDFMASLAIGAACLSAADSPAAGQPATSPSGKPWLLFTRSQKYEHDVIKRRPDGPSLLGRSLAPVFSARGIEVIESKDGSLLDPGRIDAFGGFAFYSCGDLLKTDVDPSPPMTEASKAALVAAVASGLPFVGIHSASDTFRPPREGPIEPFHEMLGGAFDSHGKQQRSSLRIVEPDFPGAGTHDEWAIQEEWYAIIHLATDIRPIHVLETAGMEGEMYAREPFPLTWTRTHGRGRVFYTGLGHREDVVDSDPFRRLIAGAIDWCRG